MRRVNHVPAFWSKTVIFVSQSGLIEATRGVVLTSKIVIPSPGPTVGHLQHQLKNQTSPPPSTTIPLLSFPQSCNIFAIDTPIEKLRSSSALLNPPFLIQAPLRHIPKAIIPKNLIFHHQSKKTHTHHDLIPDRRERLLRSYFTSENCRSRRMR